MHASTGCGLLLLGLASNVSAQNTTFDPAAISTPEKGKETSRHDQAELLT